MNVDAEFHFEVLKLLVQVAWADGVVEPQELAFVHELGVRWEIDAALLAQIEASVKQGKPIPQPNMGLLRSRGEETIDAVRQMVMSDGRLELDEVDVLATISEMLQLSR